MDTFTFAKFVLEREFKQEVVDEERNAYRPILNEYFIDCLTGIILEMISSITNNGLAIDVYNRMVKD